METIRTPWLRKSRQIGCGWWCAMAVLLFEMTTVTEGICPPKCNCSDEQLIVTCNGSNLNMVPITLNPSIRQLHLTHSKIHNIVASFGFYANLEYLDLSCNQLEIIETKSFEEQRHLRSLKLSHNLISNISSDTFLGLHSLHMLLLDDNSLEKLPPLAFYNLTQLRELNLSSNVISTISPEAFLRLGALRKLYLRNNRLTTIPTASFAPLSNLLVLDLGLNRVGVVPAQVFRPLRSLQRLYLDGCSLRNVTNEAFLGLDDLLALHLQNNSIRSVPPALTTLQRLEQLEMGLNELDELPAHAFKGLRYLRVLEVASAPRLEAVRKNAFSSNVDLESVRLVYNPRLVLIEPGAFEALSSLRHLSLRGNGLTSFSESLLPWDELESLDLRDNPVLCNCSLLWLRNLLSERNISQESGGFGFRNFNGNNNNNNYGTLGDGPSAVSVAQPLQQPHHTIVATCDSPSRLRGRNLAELDADDLSCYFADLRQQTLVGIVAAVVVACVGTLVLVVFKYRKRVTTVLKDKWSDGALRRKEHQYEKTNDEEESNILHAAQQTMKLTPVTEL